MENFENLIEKLEGIKKYYYKGFGDAICGCNNFIENYFLIGKGKNVNNFEKEISPLLDFYNNISFGELHGKEEFYPLFVVDKLLKEYNSWAQRMFNGESSGNWKDICGVGRTIVDVGGLYNKSLEETLKEIRRIPGQEGFEFLITDRSGGVFPF